MGREKSLVQDTHYDPGTILLPGILDALATDFFLEPIAVWNWLTLKSFWRALTFLGGKRRGTLRPFPSRPSALFPSSTQIPHFLRLIESALVLSPLLSLREQASVWLAPDACVSPTHTKRRKMQFAVL